LLEFLLFEVLAVNAASKLDRIARQHYIYGFTEVVALDFRSRDLLASKPMHGWQ